MKKVDSITVAFILILCNVLTAGTYNGGSGIADDPYQIATATQLGCLGSTPADWGKHFLLTADIDMYRHGHIAIGSQINPFTGHFDGNGHIISELRTYHNGVFECVGGNAEITNLGVEDVDIDGGICVGGLIGYLKGEAIVTECYVTGSVTGYAQVGGLVGNIFSGMVANSYAKCSVICYYDAAGGFAGDVGVNGYIAKCYSAGTVGGECDPDICYPGSSVPPNETTNLGGFAGVCSGTVESCFWDIQNSGCQTSAAGIGKTKGQMWTLSTFTDADWNFTQDGSDGEWFDFDYPGLFWETQREPGPPDAFNGLINMEDFAMIAAHWGSTSCGRCNGADVDEDGAVDGVEFYYLIHFWLNCIMYNTSNVSYDNLL